MSSIVVDDLVKTFPGTTAVNRVSFAVEDGEVFGMLGPNGAGKTTTIRILATVLKASSGRASVCGCDVHREPHKVRRCIGIVFQDQTLDDRLTAVENLDFHARLYGMAKQLRKERIAQVLKLVELWSKRDVIVKNFSGGMCRRLEIARGLMHYPQVLFLDEPTLGLDAQTRRTIWKHIQLLNKREGIAILLTTHYMDEADILCERIGIIDEGKMLVLDTPEQLKSTVGKDIVTLQVSSVEQMRELAGHLEWIDEAHMHDDQLNLQVTRGAERIPQLIQLAQNHGLQVDSVNLHRPTLEDVFLHYTGRSIRDESPSGRERMSAKVRAWRRR